MRDRHQGFFDRLASEWDLAFTAEDLERLSRIVDRIEVLEGYHILDLGCGTGVLFDLLRRKVGESGLVTGVDFSIEMARKAHHNFPMSNINVVEADAMNLPFHDETFDMVVAFASFPHFADQQAAINEIHRVLKNGGKFYIMHLESSNHISEQHHRIGGAVAHDEVPTEDHLRSMFDTSHFTEVTIEDHPGLYLAVAVNSR